MIFRFDFSRRSIGSLSAILIVGLALTGDALRAAPDPVIVQVTGPLTADPLVDSQWHLENSGEESCQAPGIDLGIRDAWEITRGSPDVIIVILDSGIEADHPDLEGQLLPREDRDWDFSDGPSRDPVDSFGHGTQVAGLAVARADNGEGGAGVAPGCRLLPLKVSGPGLDGAVLEALEYVQEFVELHPDQRFVLSASITLSSRFQERVEELIAGLRERGVPCFFSAGNFGREPILPARARGAIAVGAIGADGRAVDSFFRPECPSMFTTARGPELDLTAPGLRTLTTDLGGPAGSDPGDYHPEFGGTSAASPLAASVAALMLSANPELTVIQLEAILFLTARDGVGLAHEDLPGWDPIHGWGLVRADEAVRVAFEVPPVRRGDANLDGRVELADAVAILEYLFPGTFRAPCRMTLDVQDDGRVNVTDAIHLIRFLYFGGPPPPEPFLEAGFDPTPDPGLPVCGR